jgi:hypothetical protein
MAAPNPLTSFNAINDSRGYGGILFLDWTYPTVLPTAWKLFVFKKQGSAVTDQQIADYFAGSLTATQLQQLGIFVYNNLPASVNFLSLKDFVVENANTYYYKALIRDTTANANSTIAEASGTPESAIYMRVVDAKDIIAKAVEKTLQTAKTISGYHPQIEKDIRVFKSHGERQAQDNFFVVNRVSGQNINRTMSNIIAELADAKLLGQIDYDVLQVEWICVGVGERRDKYTLIMRGMRTIFEHFVMQFGDGAIGKVETIMVGDSEINYGVEPGAPALRGVMNVVVQTEQIVQIGRNDTGIWDTLEQTYIAP